MKIFVAGGTSGIGFELASRYGEQGHKVAVCGRNLSKMSTTALGALQTYQLDICNPKALSAAVTDFACDELDMMIISAGNYADDAVHSLTYSESTEMLKVNIAGMVNVLEVARKAMQKQQKGHIVVLASVSGLLHYPKATIYSKTKRALIQITDAYRAALANFGICITLVAPGYVDTPRLRELNNNDLSRKPFMISCPEAAQIIMRGIAQNKEVIVFPAKMKYLMSVLSCLPSWALNIIMYKKAKWMNRE